MSSLNREEDTNATQSLAKDLGESRAPVEPDQQFQKPDTAQDESKEPDIAPTLDRDHEVDGAQEEEQRPTHVTEHVGLGLDIGLQQPRVSSLPQHVRAETSTANGLVENGKEASSDIPKVDGAEESKLVRLEGVKNGGSEASPAGASSMRIWRQN
jgi:hypothetical protein